MFIHFICTVAQTLTKQQLIVQVYELQTRLLYVLNGLSQNNDNITAFFSIIPLINNNNLVQYMEQQINAIQTSIEKVLIEGENIPESGEIHVSFVKFCKIGFNHSF